MARALPCHGRGCGFETRWSRNALVTKFGKRYSLRTSLLEVRVLSGAQSLCDGNWHTSDTQNIRFVGSTPTEGTLPL